MKTCVLTLTAALLLAATPALADYYVASDLNGWTPNDDGWLMSDVNGDGSFYQLGISGAGYAGRHEWKVTDGSWDFTAPGDNAKADMGAGDFTFNFYPGEHTDGWMPQWNRVGYEDAELHGWEAIGSFEGWAGQDMTAMGGGMYALQYTVPMAGDYEFKFRRTDDWDISIGDDFSNYGHNIVLTTTADNAEILFELDLPNGRWRTSVVPEPASIVILAAMGLLIRRR